MSTDISRALKEALDGVLFGGGGTGSVPVTPEGVGVAWLMVVDCENAVMLGTAIPEIRRASIRRRPTNLFISFPFGAMCAGERLIDLEIESSEFDPPVSYQKSLWFSSPI